MAARVFVESRPGGWGGPGSSKSRMLDLLSVKLPPMATPEGEAMGRHLALRAGTEPGFVDGLTARLTASTFEYLAAMAAACNYDARFRRMMRRRRDRLVTWLAYAAVIRATDPHAQAALFDLMLALTRIVL